MASLYFANRLVEQEREIHSQENSPNFGDGSGIPPAESNSPTEMQTNHDSVSSDLTQETGNVSFRPETRTSQHVGQPDQVDSARTPNGHAPTEGRTVNTSPSTEPSDLKEDSNKKNHRLPLLICLCAFLLVIAGGAGAGVGVILSKRSR